MIRGKDIQTFREYGMFLQRQCLWLYVIHCNVSQMRKRTSVRTEHMSVIWSCIKINGVVSREKKKTGDVSRPSHTLSSFSSDRSKTVPLFHYFFLCALVVSNVAFFCHHLRNKLFPTVLKWNAPDKAQLSLGCTHLSTSERVLKWVQPKLNCALSRAFEHGWK